METIRRKIQNALIVIFSVTGVLLVLSMKSNEITKEQAVSYFFLALAPLVLCEIVGAIFTGTATAKGLSVHRENSKHWFWFLTSFYILLFVFCLYEASMLWV